MQTRVNNIRVIALTAVLAAALGGCAGSRTEESTGETVDDSVITTKVKTAMLAEKKINSTEISVQTFKGRVLLSGYVKSPGERQRAEGVVRSVGGVKEINDQLELR